jgi:hypothetical protein
VLHRETREGINLLEAARHGHAERLARVQALYLYCPIHKLVFVNSTTKIQIIFQNMQKFTIFLVFLHQNRN